VRWRPQPVPPTKSAVSALPALDSLTLPLPDRAQPLGAVDSAAAYLRSCASSALRKIRGRRRTDSQVSSEYDQGTWSKTLREAAWETAASLQDYVADTSDRTMLAMLDGRLCRVPVADYYRFRFARLRQLLDRYGVAGTPLVELGSGVGTNLFRLRADGLDRPMRGFDISPTGVEVARSVASRFGIEDMRFDLLDLRQKDHPNYRGIAGATVFTYYCLEQIPDATREVLEAVAAAKPARVIHVEPSTELLNWTKLSDAATKAYVLSQDYQRTLMRTARAMEAEGKLTVEACGRMHFAPTQRNFPLVLVWTPRAKGGSG
jgi:hypothetical protein